ncbi:MAG: hypothetical protein JNM27_08355 [Leptospirales bacterium]|nr:hypothetical protein [Leptospirales bacterium]
MDVTQKLTGQDHADQSGNLSSNSHRARRVLRAITFAFLIALGTAYAAPARYMNPASGFSLQPPAGWKPVPADHFRVLFAPPKDKVTLGITASTISQARTTHDFLREIAREMGVRIKEAQPLSPQARKRAGATDGIKASFVGEVKDGKSTERFEEIWIFRKKNRIYTIVLDGDLEVRAKRRDEIEKAILTFWIH